MGKSMDRMIRICILFLGHSARELEFPAKDIATVKQFLIENYESIFSSKPPAKTDHLFDWESFTNDNIDWFKRYLNFYFVAGDLINKTTIHLIDKIDVMKITISNSGIYTNDLIRFYLEEKLRGKVESILQTQYNDFVIEIIEAIERLLTTVDAQILLENFALFKERSLIEHFTKNIIPSKLWRKLNHPELIYYKHFLVSLANQLHLLDHCLNSNESKSPTITQSNKEEWLHNLLYRINTQMLTLMSIPEAFVRNIYPKIHKFSKALQECGVSKLSHNDGDYYSAQIATRSISDVYQPFFKSIGINDYFEFISLCANSPISSQEISIICQTFRIIFNKLKHAAYIEIIRSRDAESIRQAQLSTIEREIQELENDLMINPLERRARISRLLIKKEVVEKVGNRHELIDFDAPDFKKSNGIRVFLHEGNWYTICLADVELTFKLVIGILTIIQRSAPIATVA